MSTLTFTSVESRALQFQEANIVRNASFVFLACAAALITIAFIVPFGESWNCSLTYEDFFGADHLKPEVQSGTLARQIALGSLGLLGLAAWAWPSGKTLRLGRGLSVLCIAYLAWCAISCLWSDNVAMSLRRCIALMCEVAAGMAIAKHLSARQFVSIVLACTLAWLGIGIVSELSLGTFRPWLQGYRFAGIFHPNIMGVNCALLIMASLYLVVVGARLKNGLLHVIAGVTFAFLLLTGSRTALGAMLVSIAALWFITAPASKKLVYLLFPGLVVVFVGVAAGLGAFEDFADVIAMGRNDSEMSSLTGRVPLWQELLNNYLPLNPLAGHGYGAFWTENHIAEISHYQTWAVYHAHSTYIDLVLNVGLIGAALYLTGMVLAFLSASRLEARHVRGGYGFVVMMIVYGLTAGLLESHVGSTWFFSFFGVCGICYLVFRDDRETQSASPDTESPRIRAQSFARTAT